MGFGNRLKEILKKKGITIKQLSEMTNISVNTLYSITKRDTNMPDSEIIDKIANALEIDKQELLISKAEYEIIKNELKSSLNSVEKIEIEFREKLLEISEMLNADALGKLIVQAIDLVQEECYRSIFYKKDE